MAMGSSLSPVICNLFLENLEGNSIKRFDPKPIAFYTIIIAI
jgi:hypothetical protein